MSHRRWSIGTSRDFLTVAAVVLVTVAPWVRAQGQPPAGPPENPVPQSRPDVFETGVVAIVNGEVITEGEVRSHSRARLTGLSAKDRNRLLEEKLLDLILDRILDQGAERLQLVLNPQHILSFIERQKEELGGENQYREFLTEKGMTNEEYVTDVTKRSQRHLYVGAFAGGSQGIGDVLRPEYNVDPTANEIRAYYEQHREDQFSSDAEAHIWYMFITPSSLTRAQVEAGTSAQALAKTIRQDLMTGADFATLVQLYSPITRESGGDAGWHKRETSFLDPTILEYAFTAPLGQVSEPIPLSTGYVLVKVTERREAAVVPFAEAQLRIKEAMRNRRVAQATFETKRKMIEEAYIVPGEYKNKVINKLYRDSLPKQPQP